MDFILGVIGFAFAVLAIVGTAWVVTMFIQYLREEFF